MGYVQYPGFAPDTLLFPAFQKWQWGFFGLLYLLSRICPNSASRQLFLVPWDFWGWSWNSNTLATSCKELTHWKRPWCWEGLGAGGERDDRGWDGWMASPTRWTWVWVNSGSWWWTGRPGMLWFMGSQRVGHDWATELNWTEGFFVFCFLRSLSRYKHCSKGSQVPACLIS